MKRPFLMTILSVIISALFFNAAYAGNTISLIIYYMINRTYFKHRAHLFVN